MARGRSASNYRGVHAHADSSDAHGNGDEHAGRDSDGTASSDLDATAGPALSGRGDGAHCDRAGVAGSTGGCDPRAGPAHRRRTDADRRSAAYLDAGAANPYPHGDDGHQADTRANPRPHTRLMSDMELWHFIRGAGLVAYGLLWLSVVLGISVRARTLDGVIHRAWVFELHQTVGIMGVIATALHVVLVTQNVHVPLGWRQAFVPMSAEWRPWAVTFGVLALYLMAIVGLSSLLRRGLPFSVWRLLHYAAFPAWVLALAHGILA
ncbi:MAG: ferric reductase-like transmembrane domain-containing protein, partial [Dehalococcoidia bacterium]